MYKYFLYFFLFIAGSFAACKKSKSGTPSIMMQAEVSKSLWTSYHATATLSRSPALHITILADSANTHMRLDLGNYSGVGTYSLYDSANAATYTAFYDIGGNITHTATSGQIVVTTDTVAANGGTEIMGTFKFLADTVEVQNGTFVVYLNLN